MTLISTVLTLQPTTPTAVPVNLGRATHAWFLDQVRTLDPALAESLHAPNQERPFTVSNLWGARAWSADRDASPQTAQHDGGNANLRGARPPDRDASPQTAQHDGGNANLRGAGPPDRDASPQTAQHDGGNANLRGAGPAARDPSGFDHASSAHDAASRNPKGLAQATLSPDRPCFLRLSSYQPALSALIAERLLPGLPETIGLAGATLRVAGATTDPAQHPWAGQTTVQDLLLAHTLHGQPPPRVTLRFASPTMFKSDNKYLPLPLPRLVFEGLARRWNAFAPVALPEEVTRFAEECLAISRYRLHTERMAFGEQGERGALR